MADWRAALWNRVFQFAHQPEFFRQEPAALQQLQPTLSIGTFLAMFSAFNAFVSSLVTVAEALSGSLEILPLYEEMRPILECLPEADESKVSPGRFRGSISLSHAVFRYPGSGGPGRIAQEGPTMN